MKANSIAVLGLQWGDEGKGKVIDYLSRASDAVVRFGGGSNAGHTIVAEGQKFILRLLPSGILHPGKLCFIGPGVACDPEVLESEIAALENRGISTAGRIFVDFGSQLVLPLHKAKDGYEESSRGSRALDTTKRGIGPSYADRVSRVGIRVSDLFDRESLEAKLQNLLSFHKDGLSSFGAGDGKDYEPLFAYLCRFIPLFRELAIDVAPRLMEMIASGKPALFEGAQGSLLDVDYGTYPYTTSSHTTVGGIFTGLGIPPRYLGSVAGVVKSYMTRVGHGPFPTEILDERAAALRDKGREFGSVTGRPRRIGWLDMVALKRMIRLNGVDKLAITKLDVLDGLDKIKVCESYRVGNEIVDDLSPNHPDFFKAEPIYTELPGWSNPVSGIRDCSKMPSQARAYLEYIEKKTGTPIWLISTGFGREDTIFLDRENVSR